VNVSLYQAAAAMNAQNRWQEVIAGNIASSSVPGYKKQDVSFSAFDAGMMPSGPAGRPQAYSLPRVSSQIDFSQGEIRYTGRDTDVAVEGAGFFEVQLPNGKSSYTRDGQFHLNGQGQLVSKDGFAVMGQGGPITIDRSIQGPIRISGTGEISKGSTTIGRLKVVGFADPSTLASVGGGQFLPTDPSVQPQDVPNPTVRQGYIEGSNTSTVSEMTGLISSMRAFEANQKVIQTQDERMGKVISDLGSPT
jgi:flagellar basal body rod protein FlgG